MSRSRPSIPIETQRLTGNCSTTLLSRTNAAEMAERSYGFLNPDIKAAATRLEKGQLVLSHAVFRASQLKSNF